MKTFDETGTLFTRRRFLGAAAAPGTGVVAWEVKK